jgi:hypothetical protein
MLLPGRDDQIIDLFAPVAGIGQSQLLPDRVARDIGAVALQIADQVAESLFVLDMKGLHCL